jgi:hypothetical protein
MTECHVPDINMQYFCIIVQFLMFGPNSVRPVMAACTQKRIGERIGELPGREPERTSTR